MYEHILYKYYKMHTKISSLIRLFYAILSRSKSKWIHESAELNNYSVSKIYEHILYKYHKVRTKLKNEGVSICRRPQHKFRDKTTISTIITIKLNILWSRSAIYNNCNVENNDTW